MKTLRSETITSVKWTTFQSGIVALVGFALQIVQGRLLLPVDFANIAIVMVVVSFVELIENLGLSQAIIQKEEVTINQMSSLFFFNIMLGILLSSVVYFSANSLGSLFKMPELEALLKVSSFNVLLSCPSHLFRAIMQKNLQFRALAIIRISRQVILFCLTTILLILGLGVLGVVISFVASTAVSTAMVCSYCLRNALYRIKIYFNPHEVLPFLRFGSLVSIKQLLTFFAHRFDEVLIGYFLPSEVLGVYYFGKNLLERVRNLLTSSFASVLLPVFSRVKTSPNRLIAAYEKITKLMAFVAFPLFAIIAVTADVFVPLIFGVQWLDSVVVFRVFSVSMIFLVLTANIATSMLYAKNRPGLVLWIDIVSNALYFVSLSIIASQGLTAIMIVYSLYVIGKTTLLQFGVAKNLGTSLLSYFTSFRENLISTLLMTLAVVGWLTMTQSLGLLPRFVLSLIIGIAIYFLSSLVFAKGTLKEFVLAIRNR